MKIVLIVLAAVVALVVLVTIIGAMLPKAHTATRSAVVAQSPEAVYAFALAKARDPQYEIVEDQPRRRLVTRIADKSLPYGGSWTIDLAPEASGTRVTITENGEVYDPLFRFLSRYVFGHTATMDAYLKELAAKQ